MAYYYALEIHMQIPADRNLFRLQKMVLHKDGETALHRTSTDEKVVALLGDLAEIDRHGISVKLCLLNDVCGDYDADLAAVIVERPDPKTEITTYYLEAAV